MGLDMEIDITSFFQNADPSEFSASIAETGLKDIGKRTWAAAKGYASELPILTTPEQLAALRAYVKGFGAWDDAEIAAWDDAECNALFVQMVSGDMREGGLDTGAPDWSAYEAGAEAGRYSGSIYRGDDGRVYYQLGD